MATVEAILLPDIGDFSDVEIIEILVAPGDRIEAEQSLLTLESDKATIEIPAPRGGVITEVLVKVGDRVSQGSPLFQLEAEGTVEADDAPAGPERAEEPPAHTPAQPQSEIADQPTKGAAAPLSGPISVTLPDIGDFHDVPVIEILVSPGDRVEVEQSLVTLESDKATMEIPSPRSGVVESVAVAVGDKLNQGGLILTLRPDAGAAASTDASPEEAEAPQAPASAAKPESSRAPRAAASVQR
ncbi:MAG: biotin/lipoyl-containing protein, partial [Chromatiaceae bacterium]